MTEKHRDWFPAGQYFVGVAGMAAMRRILSRPSEGRARIDEVRAVIESYDEFPNDLRIDVVEHDVDSGYTGMGVRTRRAGPRRVPRPRRRSTQGLTMPFVLWRSQVPEP